MRSAPLSCPVRGCGLALERRDRASACPAGHAFDVARSGYVNLLQPQDRRSAAAGDSKEAIEARAALLAAGVGRTLIESIVQRVGALDLGSEPVCVDLGSGSGDVLAAVNERRPITGVGVDLSTAAAEHAARRFRRLTTLTWVVANADRRLPLLDGSVDVLLSIHGRRNAAEAARVLSPSGTLLIAVPAPDDLIELRARVQGKAIERDRGEAVRAEHQPLFELVDRSLVRETAALERDALLNLLRGTYRGARHADASRVAAIERMTITLASDVFVFRRSA